MKPNKDDQVLPPDSGYLSPSDEEFFSFDESSSESSPPSSPTFPSTHSILSPGAVTHSTGERSLNIEMSALYERRKYRKRSSEDSDSSGEGSKSIQYSNASTAHDGAAITSYQSQGAMSTDQNPALNQEVLDPETAFQCKRIGLGLRAVADDMDREYSLRRHNPIPNNMIMNLLAFLFGHTGQ